MREKGTAVAFVDLDGTLFDGYIWVALARHHLRHWMKLGTLGLYLGLHLPLWPLLQLGMISPETFYHSWGANMAWLVRGIPVKGAEEIWEWLIDFEILPAIRPEILAAIRAHQEEGQPVILLSGTFQPLLESLAARLGLSAALATPLDQQNGRYTGRIQPPLNIGQGKVERITSYSQQFEGGIDLARSTLYTDSIVDLPVLNIIGNPIAVYPDKDLARLASDRSWRIIPA